MKHRRQQRPVMHVRNNDNYCFSVFRGKFFSLSLQQLNLNSANEPILIISLIKKGIFKSTINSRKQTGSLCLPFYSWKLLRTTVFKRDIIPTPSVPLCAISLPGGGLPCSSGPPLCRGLWKCPVGPGLALLAWCCWAAAAAPQAYYSRTVGLLLLTCTVAHIRTAIHG